VKYLNLLFAFLVITIFSFNPTSPAAGQTDQPDTVVVTIDGGQIHTQVWDDGADCTVYLIAGEGTFSQGPDC